MTRQASVSKRGQKTQLVAAVQADVTRWRTKEACGLYQPQDTGHEALTPRIQQAEGEIVRHLAQKMQHSSPWEQGPLVIEINHRQRNKRSKLDNLCQSLAGAYEAAGVPEALAERLVSRFVGYTQRQLIHHWKSLETLVSATTAPGEPTSMTDEAFEAFCRDVLAGVDGKRAGKSQLYKPDDWPQLEMPKAIIEAELRLIEAYTMLGEDIRQFGREAKNALDVTYHRDKIQQAQLELQQRYQEHKPRLVMEQDSPLWAQRCQEDFSRTASKILAEDLQIGRLLRLYAPEAASQQRRR